jgi:hypothetical protein
VLEKGTFTGTIRSDDRDTGISRGDEIDIVERCDFTRINVAEIAGLDKVHEYRKLGEKR